MLALVYSTGGVSEASDGLIFAAHGVGITPCLSCLMTCAPCPRPTGTPATPCRPQAKQLLPLSSPDVDTHSPLASPALLAPCHPKGNHSLPFTCPKANTCGPLPLPSQASVTLACPQGEPNTSPCLAHCEHPLPLAFPSMDKGNFAPYLS